MSDIYGYIYKYTHIPTGLIYIGKKKSKKFLCNYLGSGPNWKQLIKNAAKSDIKQEVLQWCYSSDELNKQEKYWIAKYNSLDHTIGCNYSSGGIGGKLCPESLEKMKHTMQIKGSNKGEHNGAHGKHWYTNGQEQVFLENCPEGFYPGMRDETNNKRKEKLIGQKRTTAQKEHYRQSKLGDKNPMKKLTGDKHPRNGKCCYISPDKLTCKYFIPGEEPEGWEKGMLYNFSKIPNRQGKNNPAFGKHWYNNGVIQCLAKNCPNGFTKGQLKKVGDAVEVS